MYVLYILFQTYLELLQLLHRKNQVAQLNHQDLSNTQLYLEDFSCNSHFNFGIFKFALISWSHFLRFLRLIILE